VKGVVIYILTMSGCAIALIKKSKM